jgi:ATP-dependent 26S proteasome regulatory subunit
MMVEKVPDSTYEMVGGLDKQIKEIKEGYSPMARYTEYKLIDTSPWQDTLNTS